MGSGQGGASNAGAPGTGGSFSTGGFGTAGTIGNAGFAGWINPPTVCGDGFLGYPEQCDDGNAVSGDGCSECVIDARYSCDWNGNCVFTACGDGRVDSFGDGDGGWEQEECDDFATESGDGCSSSCKLESGYACFSPGYGYGGGGAGGAPSGSECHEVVCGDGLQDSYYVPGEEPPPGTAGTGFGSGGSAGAMTGGSGGAASDGRVWLYEACDDGNATSGDGCSDTCEPEAGYVCAGPGEPCRQPRCGDGFQDFIPNSGSGTGGSVGTGGGGGFAGGPSGTYEQCDDGNDVSSDGCSESCETEPGYACWYPGEPCRLIVCGDFVTDWPEETCDDGNTVSEDGCSSTCQYEGGYGGAGGFAGSFGTGGGSPGTSGTGFGGTGFGTGGAGG